MTVVISRARAGRYEIIVGNKVKKVAATRDGAMRLATVIFGATEIQFVNC